MQIYGANNINSPDPRDILDLFSLMEFAPEVKRIISQVLRLIPRISHKIKRSGVQTYAMGGYEGMTGKGNFDSLVLTEFAYPQDIFLHRLLNYEALYYGREGDQDQKKELAYIISQSGLEVLGDYDLLSKGLTLALSNTMQNKGYEVRQSFVGSQFTEAFEVKDAVDINRIVYYKDKKFLNAELMLESVIKQLKKLKNKYADIQVFWVITENWDIDNFEEHIDQYKKLKTLAGHQAWYIHIKENIDIETETDKYNKYVIKPASASQFHQYNVLTNDLIWNDEKFIRILPDVKGSDAGVDDIVVKSRYQLRSEPITVSRDEASKIFKLREKPETP
ncbi:MAG: hypothetical protein OMM_05819 [Candidatus Magnetoglobus multicellularis str. Araruama]|uniref:Uncharacterized protein n=1 Tax=Candidatus Magnetoglobus multicellularis str. Araruama TaxID=890399 RepID=A0A1V1NU11_9BACT|nr:MAG: hypothetical protein OMM_05819 [Candidatus Magnetoglobus multicellularis str. Araruama]